MRELFSVNEAAAIADISPEIVRTALEKKSLKPAHNHKAGKAIRYRFSPMDVLLLKLLAEFPFPLTRQDKRALWKILVQGKKQASGWSLKSGNLCYGSAKIQVVVECRHLRAVVAQNLALYRWGRRRIVSSPEVLSGEPVYRGTRIPLSHVASLFRKGVPKQEIIEDFPALSERDLSYARLYSRFEKRPGRPRKHLLIRRFQ